MVDPKNTSPAVTRVKAAISAMLGLGVDDLPMGLGKLLVITSQNIYRTAPTTTQPIYADAWASSQTEQATESIAEQNYASLIATARRNAAQAFYDPASCTTCFIADRIAYGTERAVFLHEMTHKHGRTVLGSETWRALTDQVQAWAAAPSGSSEYKIHESAVRQACASGAVGSQRRDEMLAYAVEASFKLGITPSASGHEHGAEKWLAAVIVSIENVALRLTGQPRGERAALSPLSPQDIVDLAYALAQLDTPAHTERIRQALQALTTQIHQPPGAEHLPHEAPSPIWFSALSRAIARLPDQTAPAHQWQNLLRGLTAKGVKPDEIAWSGVEDWLALQTGRVSKAMLLHYLDEHGVKVEETLFESTSPQWVFNEGMSQWERGDYIIDFGRRNSLFAHLYLKGTDRCDAEVFFGDTALEQAKMHLAPEIKDTTSYGEYAMPSGKNYRELLLTFPSKSPNTFKSKHWDESNVLAHIRFNEHIDVEAKKVLLIEEIQSDWGQIGRKTGFVDAALETTLPSVNLNHRFLAYPSILPDAPFVQKTNAWVGLCIKRMLRYAVDHGFDRLAFIDGEQVIDRFKMKKDIESISYDPLLNGGTLIVNAFRSAGHPAAPPLMVKSNVKPNDLVGLIGYRPSTQLLSSAAQKENSTRHINNASGLHLKMGGAGTIDFYDNILPAIAKKLIKSLGGEGLIHSEIVLAPSFETEQIAAPGIGHFPSPVVTPQETSAQIACDITPAMRECVLRGLPMFSLRDTVCDADDADGAALPTPQSGYP